MLSMHINFVLSFVDMAGALGLTSSDLTQDVVMARKHNIHMKLRQGGILRFTMVNTTFNT